MPRKAQPVNPKSTKRLRTLLQAEDVTQKELARRAGLSENLVSRMVQGKSPLSETSAELIHEAFPQYSAAYLLGLEDFPNAARERLMTAALSLERKERRIKAAERFLRDLGFLFEPNEQYFRFRDQERYLAEISGNRLAARELPITHDVKFFGEKWGTCSETDVKWLLDTLLSFTEFTVSRLCAEGGPYRGRSD